MNWREYLEIISEICSIFSLIISIFVAFKVIMLTINFQNKTNIKIKGDRNETIGRDKNVEY